MSDNKAKLRELYQEALKYKSQEDADGDLRFEVPGLGHFCIILLEDDPEFLKIDYPYFYDNSKNKALGKTEFCIAAEEVSRKFKAAKISVQWTEQDQTWNASAHIEAFIAGPDKLPDLELLKEILYRNITAIESARDAFITTIEGSSTPQETTAPKEEAPPAIRLIKTSDQESSE